MGYLYVIQAGKEDFYKIGVSDSDPALGRIKQLQTGNHLPLTVKYYWITTAYLHIEKILHAALTDYLTIGEWFEVPFEIIDHKITLLKEVLGTNDDVPIVSMLSDYEIEIPVDEDLEGKVLFLHEQGLPVSRILKKLGFTNSTTYAKFKPIIDEIILSSKNESYTCELCEYSTTSVKALNGHMKAHSLKEVSMEDDT